MSDIANKVETLMEAMPYLQKYQGKIIVIKYGGNAMINEELKDAVMHDVVLLKLLGMKPVLSHGGGPGINKMLEKLDIPVEFIDGLRYTSADIMRVVEMVLVGQVNTELVGFINKLGGKAVGLSGVSGGPQVHGADTGGAGQHVQVHLRRRGGIVRLLRLCIGLTAAGGQTQRQCQRQQ